MFAEKSLAPRLSSLPASEAEGSRIPDISVPELALDRVQASDEPFLYRTFASTRAEEMALTGWIHEQQETFLRMQYEAQRSSYRVQLPDAEYWVIRFSETAVGRLIVNQTPQEIHIVDIALLPEFRRHGIGSILMKAIMQEAAQTGKAVSLHVERFNPGLRWYERLGFSVVDTGPMYLEMVWRAAQPDVQESCLGVAHADSSD
jgi:ribosomal protein S18 acetylase RimI-like enzyme